MGDKIRLGISACLLGEKVRYDGGHQYDSFLVEALGPYVEYVPVCPEVEMGLPTPREALRLVGEAKAPRLVFSRSGEDVTERMISWAHQRVADLESEGLCGFVFKGRSPSSGMERVKLYDPHGVPNPRGVGLFARIFMEHFPLLPVEEDGRLHDPRLRENFIERLLTAKRWQDEGGGTMDRGALVAFHTRHKLLLMAHSLPVYRQLGRLLARSTAPMPQLCAEYLNLLMAGLHQLATPETHVNVLHHLLGFFKRQLSGDEKEELLELIDRYRRQLVPLIVPVTLINHYVRKYQQAYLQQQIYLDPYPPELKLRNRV